MWARASARRLSHDVDNGKAAGRREDGPPLRGATGRRRGAARSRWRCCRRRRRGRSCRRRVEPDRDLRRPENLERPGARGRDARADGAHRAPVADQGVAGRADPGQAGVRQDAGVAVVGPEAVGSVLNCRGELTTEAQRHGDLAADQGGRGFEAGRQPGRRSTGPRWSSPLTWSSVPAGIGRPTSTPSRWLAPGNARACGGWGDPRRAGGTTWGFPPPSREVSCSYAPPYRCASPLSSPQRTHARPLASTRTHRVLGGR